MTKKEMEKKIQQLERRIDFLLVELKTINNYTQDWTNLSLDERIRRHALIQLFSEADHIRNKLSFIEEYDCRFNFYDSNMTIEDYYIDENDTK